MIRMGHDSMRAALIYQHASDTGDRRIADALDAVIEAAESTPAGERSDGDESTVDPSGTDADRQNLDDIQEP